MDWNWVQIVISPLPGNAAKTAGPVPAAGRHFSIIHRAVSALLVILVAYEAAALTWDLVGLARQGGGQRPFRPPLSIPTSTDSPGPGAKPATLAGLHLFGHAEQEGAAHATALTEPVAHPQTTLNLHLVGVYVSSSPKQSLAVIAEKGKKASEVIYGAGDQLPGNALLSEIRTDRVILLRAGAYESLPLEAPPSTPAPPAAADDKAGQVHGRGPALEVPPAQPISGGRSQVTIDRRRWQTTFADLPALATEVGVEPFPTVGRGQQGYRLLAKRQSRLFADLGLVPGDIVVEVNGLSLKDPSTALQAFATIKKARAITVRLIRDGREETKEITIGRPGDAE